MVREWEVVWKVRMRKFDMMIVLVFWGTGSSIASIDGFLVRSWKRECR